MSKKLDWERINIRERLKKFGSENPYLELPQTGSWPDQMRYFHEYNEVEDHNKIKQKKPICNICNICNTSFKYEYDLHKHLMNEHNKFLCDECNNIYENVYTNQSCPQCGRINQRILRENKEKLCFLKDREFHLKSKRKDNRQKSYNKIGSIRSVSYENDD